MKRSLVLLFVVVAVLLSLVTVQAPANAAGATSAPASSTVFAVRLRIRDTPSVRGKTLEVVKRGATLTILGKDAARPHWLKVQAADGVTGWVSLGWVRLGRGLLLKNISVMS